MLLQIFPIRIYFMTLGFTLLFGLFGLGLVFQTWKSREDTNSAGLRGLFLTAGWSCILLSICLLTTSYGVEFGLVYATCLLFFLPVPFIAFNLQARQPVQATQTANEPINWQFNRWPKQLLTGLFLVVACFGFALLATLALSIPLDWSAVSRMTFMVLLFPLFWACAAIFFLYHTRKLRAATWIIGLSVISGLAIFLTR